MCLKAFKGRVPVQVLRPVILVLDASESAQSERVQIRRLAEQILQRIPLSAVMGVWFLGNGTPYAAPDFVHCSEQWFRENALRCSLITPVFEQLSLRWPQWGNPRIAVIGSGTIFDLEDWGDSPQLEATVLVGLAKPLASSDLGVCQLQNPSPDQVLQEVYDPIVGLRISGPGFMPYWWTSSHYRLTLEHGQATLEAEKADNYALDDFRCWVAEGGTPTAVATYQSGRTSSVELGLQEDDALPWQGLQTGPQKGWLSPEEVAVFRQALSKTPFLCPHCKQLHSWDTFSCRPGRGFPEPIYRSLRRWKGLVVFRATAQGVEFYMHQGAVLPMGPSRVAVYQTRGAQVFQFDAATKAWQSVGELLPPYYPVGKDCYVVAF